MVARWDFVGGAINGVLQVYVYEWGPSDDVRVARVGILVAGIYTWSVGCIASGWRVLGVGVIDGDGDSDYEFVSAAILYD